MVESEALKKLREKLAFLKLKLSTNASALQEFEIKDAIQDTRAKICEMSGNLDVVPDDLGLPSRFRIALRDKLLAGAVSREIVELAYLRCRGEVVRCNTEEDFEAFDWVVNELGDRPFPEDAGQHPAIRFAALLVSQNIAKVKLCEWIEDVARHFPIKNTRGVVDCPECESLEDRVLIKVEPTGVGYRIDGWRITSVRGAAALCETNAKIAQLSAVEAHLEDSVEGRDVVARIGDVLLQTKLCPDTTVELCLPFALLCLPIEDIKIKRVRHYFRVAGKHPVLIRSWERNYSSEFEDVADDWRHAWNSFQAAAVSHRLSQSFFEDPLAFEKLMQLGAKGLVLQFCPGDAEDATSTVIRDLIEAGVPVALWPRGETMLGAEFDSPCDWTSTVLGLRQASENAKVTMLWDDPDRVPKTPIFQSPRVPSKG